MITLNTSNFLLCFLVLLKTLIQAKNILNKPKMLPKSYILNINFKIQKNV